MKKSILAVSLIFLIASGAFAASILKAQFGWPKKTIKAEYKSMGLQPSFEDADSLGYKKTLEPFPEADRVLYEFYNDELYAVKVTLNASRMLSSNFAAEDSAVALIDKYNFYKDLLTQQYGVGPMTDEYMPKDFDNDELRLGAIKTGRGYYKSEWETGYMRILLVLAGSNGNLDFEIYYVYKPIFSKKEQVESDWKMKWL